MTFQQVFPEQTVESRSALHTNHYLAALLYGGQCLGYASLAIDDSAAVALPAMPANTKYALLFLEANAAQTDKDLVVRFREDGVDPTDTEGMPLGHLSPLEVKGTANLTKFRVIGIQAGLTHTMRIQFYGPGSITI